MQNGKMNSGDLLDIMQKAQRKKTLEMKRAKPLRSDFTDPHYGYPGYGRGVVDHRRRISCQILRRIAEKAWMINTIIGHIIDKVIPYMRPMDGKKPRGWKIVMKDPEMKPSDEDKKRIKELTEFFLHTGFVKDRKRDSLSNYTKKIIRDIYTLDQANSEIQRNLSGGVYAFYAVDAGTILKCTEEGYMGDDKIEYVQIIDSVVRSTYQERDLVFQVSTPRTDIYVNGYGYSKTEQAVDLVISMINTFAFNSGAFTEDKLPRGMLLLNGDVGIDEVEEIEDYIVDIMSSPTAAQGKWSVPIIPAYGKDQTLQWVPLGGTNRDMEFSRWYDELKAAICALFGVDMESVGLKTDKSAKIIESGSKAAREYSDDKAIGTTLTMLEDHYNRILDEIDPEYEFVFEGFEQDDSKDKREAEDHELKTRKSINEIRAEHDEEPIKAEWADVPGLLSPQVTQVYLNDKNAKASEQGATGGTEGEESGGQGEEAGGDAGGGNDQVSDEDVNDFFKSLPRDFIVVEI